jgi:hypothetical protein
MARTVRCKLLAPLLSQEEKDNGPDEVFTGPQEAKERIIRLNLWKPMGKKGKSAGEKLIELPKRSICKKDFEGNDQALEARARSVANAIGERTAAGRIGSMELTRKGKDTFASWWDGAGADRKARLLSDKKHFDSLTAAEKQRLNTVLRGCPFRGEEPVPAEKKEEGGEPEGLPIRPPTQEEGDSTKKKGKGKPSQGN